MKTIVTSLAMAAIFGLAAPTASQAGDAHHGNGHHSTHSSFGQHHYGHGGYQFGHSGHYSQGYQSGHGYGHAPVYPGYGHGNYLPSYGHGGYGHNGYQPGYGHTPSHNGGHINLPGIHFSFGGHHARH